MPTIDDVYEWYAEMRERPCPTCGAWRNRPCTVLHDSSRPTTEHRARRAGMRPKPIIDTDPESRMVHVAPGLWMKAIDIEVIEASADGLNLAEIGQRIGKSSERVRQNLARGMAGLRYWGRDMGDPILLLGTIRQIWPGDQPRPTKIRRHVGYRDAAWAVWVWTDDKGGE